jgi:hypothetical protein
MPEVGFEPTIAVFERGKTFHQAARPLCSALLRIGNAKYQYDLPSDNITVCSVIMNFLCEPNIIIGGIAKS